MISESGTPHFRAKAPPNRPRIAIVDEEFPYPANSGKRLRTLNLVTRLAATHELTYVAYRNAKPDETMVARTYLESNEIATVEVNRLLQPKSGLKFYGKLAANLASPLPYSVSSHQSTEMQAVLAQVQRNFGIQLWHCEWTPYAEFFRGWETCPVVVAAHNVESLIWKRYFETEKNLLKKWYIQKQWQKFQSFERWAFHRAIRTITVSENDRALAISEFGAETVDVIENGVDTKKYSANRNTSSRESQRMIFLGSLDWRPNTDGLRQFISTSFQEIVADQPNIVLDIVGRNPANWLLDLASENPNIELHADVPDVLPFLAKAALMVVPLRIGGGSRLKIIEAAANGLPVVSTRVGAEGLDYRGSGQHLFTVESVEEMTNPVLEVLNNPESSKLMAQRALQLTEEQYDWDMLAKKQALSWKKAINEPQLPRTEFRKEGSRSANQNSKSRVPKTKNICV